MNGNGRTSYPFTPSQWQELEHQALVYKYLISGMPVPPDLLFTIRRSFDSSRFLLPHNVGWGSFHMGFGKKIDPEPGRCRRTDGKKWRCSKEAYPDSKYCERHMHRGRNRSRKPVEILSSSSSHAPPPPVSSPAIHSRPPNFFFPEFSCPRAEEAITTNLFLDSNSRSKYGNGSEEHSFFSESSSNSGGMRNVIGTNESYWKLGIGSSLSQMQQQQQQENSDNSSDIQTGMNYKTHSQNDQICSQQKQDYYNCGTFAEQPKKVMHLFLDEWGVKEEEDDKSSGAKSQSPHDFFINPKW